MEAYEATQSIEGGGVTEGGEAEGEGEEQQPGGEVSLS